MNDLNEKSKTIIENDPLTGKPFVLFEENRKEYAEYLTKTINDGFKITKKWCDENNVNIDDLFKSINETIDKSELIMKSKLFNNQTKMMIIDILTKEKVLQKGRNRNANEK